MTQPIRNGLVALIGLGLVIVLLRFGPALVGGWMGGGEGAWAESGFTLALFGPMLLIGWCGRRLAKVGERGRPPWRSLGLGAATGLGGVLLATGYTDLAGTLAWLQGPDAGLLLALGLIVIAVQVAAEEYVFRGWLQPVAMTLVGRWVAVPLVAAIFAGLHLLAGNASGVVPLLNLFLGGMLFGLIAAGRLGLAGAFGAHFAWNAGEQLLLGLDPNPGVGAFGAIVDLDLRGAALWGGSDQGLNGSWAMSLSLLALVVGWLLASRTSNATSKAA
jgi:membrane protease YdiL (CAAX protease family)